jgi:hypothetical protein
MRRWCARQRWHRAHAHTLKRAGVGKGVAARHDIAQAATARVAEFAGGGDWSAQTCAWARSERYTRRTRMLKG